MYNRFIGQASHFVSYLDSVSRAVEEADAADAVQDGVAAVLQHVMGADWRLALPLSRKDGTLHDGEVFFVQHLRHIWQLTTEKRVGTKLFSVLVQSDRSMFFHMSTVRSYGFLLVTIF